jgi:hypothetical protein
MRTPSFILVLPEEAELTMPQERNEFWQETGIEFCIGSTALSWSHP